MEHPQSKLVPLIKYVDISIVFSPVPCLDDLQAAEHLKFQLCL